MTANPRVTCVVLNWNGWKDTIECLESIFRLRYSNFCVVVCDNASRDGSLKKIKEWARGEHPAEAPAQWLSHLSCPPVQKPIPYFELTREQAESSGGRSDSQLVLIQNGANLGFAAGSNVGLRYALHDSACEFFWLLNNDTVVTADALSALVRLMQKSRDVGICGSLILSYFNPGQVQSQGGKVYKPWTARSRAPNLTLDQLKASKTPDIDYVDGASMLVSRAFLERVGLMEESYFLYFEELDWALRAKGAFKLGYTFESVIYHKEGASIGSNRDRSKRSLLSDKYLSRSKVLFTKRFLPWALPSVLIWVCLAAAYRLCTGDVERAKAMIQWSLKGLLQRA